MENTKEILTSYGITVTQQDFKEDTKLFFSLDLSLGEIKVEKMRDRFFVQKLNAFDKISIDNIELFVQKMGIKEKWNPVFYPLLKSAELVINSSRSRFEIKSNWSDGICGEWGNERFWENNEELTQKEKEEIFEYLMPGYNIKKIFDKTDTKKQLFEKLSNEGYSVDNALTKNNLTELKEEIFYDSIETLKRAIQNVEENKH